jgi:hypothetical protein
MKCRICKNPLHIPVIDLGFALPSHSFLTAEQMAMSETAYPLKVLFCEKCFLVQIDEFKSHKEIFNENYVYFSSTSRSWLQHAQTYVDAVTQRFGLSANSFVIEVASNDGYLLQFFQSKNIPCLGVEPTASTAKVAKDKGIQVIEEFFGTELAPNLPKADLLLGNNVLAHVPDIKDFLSGAKVVLKESGVITFEFPHLLNLIQERQFDTIYHEHFSYLSLQALVPLCQELGLRVFDVEELPTHGGSLRIFLTHQQNINHYTHDSVDNILIKEKNAGLTDAQTFINFAQDCLYVKLDFLLFLINAKRQGKKVVAYGAAAKGNTLLNYCGIKADLIDYVYDLSPYKQGLFLPGSHIPVMPPELLNKHKPDYIVIFPWNIKEEIVEQLKFVQEWGAKFVTCIPRVEVL